MQLHAEKVNVNKLFGTKGEQFRVPPYQRPYAWQAEQVDDLWDDLTGAVGQGHFIGSIVLSTENEDEPLIIDGQQRLTTLTLMLALIRDEYHRLGSQYAHRVQELMHSDPWAKGDAVFKLRVSEANWKVFRDLVLRAPGDPHRVSAESLTRAERERNSRLLENAARLRSRVADDLAGRSAPEQLERLGRLEETVVKKLDLVAIRVGTVADAFLLFETLNDRGLQLSAADLLKNHLLSRIADSYDSEEEVLRVAREWDLMLDDLGSGVDLVRFFRHFLLVQRPAVSKEEVYDRFKDSVAALGAEDLLAELRVAARSYGQFENPSRVDGGEAAVADVLRDLQTLRAMRCYVTLLPARRWLSSTDFVRVARMAEVLTYRYSSIAGLDAKSLDAVYHKAAKTLDDSKGEALPEALELLIGAMPDRDAFLAAFARQRMGVQYLVRYTFSRIENHLARQSEKQLGPGSKVHIEHIMPVSLSPQWRADLGDDVERHGDYLNRWGNLTLLLFSLNESASNQAFAQKKKRYEASQVEMTRHLCRFNRWGIAEIEHRQRWLADLAERIWSPEGLSAELGVLAPTLEPRRALDLAAELAECVEGLCAETSADELVELRARVLGHLSVVEVEYATRDDVDFFTAKAVADVLLRLLDEGASWNAEQRELVRGAVEYFVLADDVAPDTGPAGFDDDAEVAKAVCAALGRPELGLTR